MEREPNRLQTQAPDIGWCLVIGVVLGFWFGLILENVALGITLGLLPGLIVGVMKCSRAKTNNSKDGGGNGQFE